MVTSCTVVRFAEESVPVIKMMKLKLKLKSSSQTKGIKRASALDLSEESHLSFVARKSHHSLIAKSSHSALFTKLVALLPAIASLVIDASRSNG